MLKVNKRFWGKRPGFDFGDLIHLGVNIVFAGVLFVMVRYWNLAFLAGVLVILSKWRVLAVQPRFWLPNIKANLVDLIVGISSVVLMFHATTNTWAIIWLVLFILWLLFIKPKTSDFMVGAQALWALFVGILTIFNTVAMLEVSFIGILFVWLVSWAVARHFLGNYDEPHYKTLSLIWAFLIAQLAWMGFHWISYYRISGLRISNVAPLAVILAGTLGVLYHNFRSEKITKSKIVENTVFGGVLIFIIIVTSSWTVRL